MDLLIHEVVSQFLDSLPKEFLVDSEALRLLLINKLIMKH